MIVMSGGVSDRGIRAMPRRSLSALEISSSAALTRASQLEAALQPSSIRMASGAREVEAPTGGFQIGPAAARMISAAAANRSAVNHQGVREGVSSFGAISNNSRVGGNSMRRGRGGITLSSHHSTGRLKRPNSSNGSAKESGRLGIQRYRPP